MEKTLLVLGASQDQIFLMKTARDMGLRVLAVDMNPNARGFETADEHAVISTRDIQGLCGFLTDYQRKGRQIAGVTTMGSDIPDVVAALARHLGTPGIPDASVRLAANKYDMKVRFREKSIPIPWFEEIHSCVGLKQVIAQNGYPLIIKPVDRSGSRGVFMLNEGCDIEDLFARSKAFSHSGRVMVEEFLPGLQISTETIMYCGKGVTPGFADRNYDLLDQFLPQIMENGGWVPSLLPDNQRRQVEDLVVRASLALGIVDGVTKGDVVMTEQGPKMIELAARLSGGDFCESLVPLSTGVNYVKAAVKIAIGEAPDLFDLKPKFAQAVVNRYFFPKPGRLTDIKGIDEVVKQDWIQKLEFWYQKGDIIPPLLSHANRFGMFVAVGPNRKEVDRRAEWVYQTVKIVTEPV
jgi:biotin carboxylase